jgi:CubicO group peptidase (beta-lactamase class C family)
MLFRRALVAVSILVWVLRSGGAWTWGADLDSSRLAEIRSRMQQFVDQGEISGAVTLVGRAAGVKYLDAVGFRDLEHKAPMRADSMFRIASMTKPITAIGIMILVDEKKLAVDDPVEKHLPEFRGIEVAEQGSKGVSRRPPSRPVLVRDLLTHTGGIHGLPPDLTDLYAKRNRTLGEVIPMLARQPLDFEPGTKWSYSNTGMDVLGRVIEVVSGQRYEDFLRCRIFEPLGMTDTTFYPTADQKARLAVVYGRKDGKLVPSEGFLGLPAEAKYPIPAGGLCSTAADLARLYRMMLCGGEWDGRRILSHDSVVTMTRLQTGDLTSGFTAGMGFGFGWAVVRKPEGVTEMLSPGSYGHGGAFGTQGWIDPHKDLFVVLLIQRTGLPNADASEMRREFQRIAFSALK